MLQDFGNGVSYTGKSAFVQLQSLYENWEQAEKKSKKITRHVWKRASGAYAEMHPLDAPMFAVPMKAADMEWNGPGRYREIVELVDVPGKDVPALPPGPKWVQALEMWTRIQPTWGSRFRLFVSRDNKKHAWRLSLCNPYFQRWGFKAKKPPVQKKKKQAPSPLDPGFWNGNARGNRFVISGTEAAPAKPTKPRVGIWT